MKQKAIFLDRDGTLIHDAHYLKSPQEIRWLPGVFEDLKKLSSLGYLLIVISNQSGIGRGYFTDEDYEVVKKTFIAEAEDAGVSFAAVYHCPHWPDKDGHCSCRKPAPGLFEKAISDFDLEISECLAVGDRERDLKPARDLGVAQSFLVTADEGLKSMMKMLID